MKTKIIIFAVLCSMLMLNAQTVGDMVRLAEPGFSTNARALGMGNAFNALSNDASAMFFNPAGMGIIKRLEIAGGFDYNKVENTATLFRSDSKASNSNTSLNQMAFVFPFPTMQGSLVFGISYNKTKDFNEMMEFSGYNSGNNSLIQELAGSPGFDANIPVDLFLASTSYATNINGKLAQSGTHLSSGELENWSFAGAIEVDKNLFLGLNLAILSGVYRKELDYFEDDVTGAYTNIQADPTTPGSKGFLTFNYNTVLDWELSGYELKLGMLYKLPSIGNVGIVVQLPRSYTVKEQYVVNATSEFTTGPIESIDSEEYSSKVEYDITTPFSLTGAGSLNLLGVTIAGEMTLTDYTQAEFSDPVDMDNRILLDLNKSIKNNSRAVVNYNLGMEYTVPEVNARVRAGFFTRKSPYVDDPESFDKQFFTVGAGFLMTPNVVVDFAYLHGWWDDYIDNYGSGDSRVLQSKNLDNLAVSFHYRF